MPQCVSFTHCSIGLEKRALRAGSPQAENFEDFKSDLANFLIKIDVLSRSVGADQALSFTDIVTLRLFPAWKPVKT